MSKFNNVKSQNAVQGATKEYLVYEVMLNDKNPILIVSHAGASNDGFTNAVIQESMKEEAVPAQYRNVSADQKTESQRKNAVMFAKHVIQGWKNVIDDNGKEVKFNEQDCVDFLMSLSLGKFGRLVEYCQDEYNFSKADALTATEKETVAKNSQGDTSTS